MKPLRWTAILVLLLAVLYLAAILFLPPVRYETRFDVDRPPEIAWTVFTDASRTAEWVGGLQSIETIDGEPMAVGSRHRMVFDEDGREIVLEQELLSVIANEEFAFRMTHPSMETDVVIRFDDLGEGTRVVTTNEVRTRGWHKPLTALARSSMERRQREGYDRLKAMIEAEPEVDGSVAR